jgi:hypothetical protein
VFTIASQEPKTLLNLFQNCKLSHKDASVVGKRENGVMISTNLPSHSLNLPSIDYVGMPTDAAASTTSYHQVGKKLYMCVQQWFSTISL